MQSAERRCNVVCPESFQDELSCIVQNLRFKVSLELEGTEGIQRFVVLCGT